MAVNIDTDPVKSIKDPTLQKAAGTLFNLSAAEASSIAPGTAAPLIEIKAPQAFGLDETNYYRYARRSNFDQLGFTPYADNEAIYNEDSSAWSEIGRGLQGMLLNTTATAADMAEGTYDLITGNWGNMFESDPAAAARFEEINRVYGSSEGGVTGFLANNAINFGFMTGMMLEGLGEGVVASLVLGPEAGVGVLGAKTLAGVRGFMGIDDTIKAARIASALDNVTTPGQVSAALNRLSTTAPQWIKTGTGSVGKFVMPNLTEFMADAFTAARIGEDLPSAARGAGALFKEVQLVKAAATEAALEGGFVQNELYQEALSKYYDLNGYMPSNTELENIYKSSKEAGDRAVMANLPIIYLTDAIVMKPLLAMGKTTSRVFGKMGDVGSDLSKFGIRQTAEGTYEAVQKSFKNGLRNSFTPSGISRFGRNVFLPAVSEGLQENFQEIVSQSYKDYYSSIISDPLNIPFHDMKGTFSGIGEVLNLAVDPALRRYSGEALKGQFSAQGLETFLSGAFIGGLTGMGGNKLSRWAKMVTEEGRKEVKLLDQQEVERRQELVDILNSGAKDVYALFNPKIKNYIDQSRALAEWQKAKQEGDEKKAKDIMEELRFSHLMTVLQTGQMNNFKQKLASLQQLDDQGVMEATGLDNAAEARQRITETLSYADNLEKKFKAVEKEYENPFDTSQYAPGSDAFNRVRTNHFAYEQAKRDLVFLEETEEKTKERLESLRSDISRRNSSGNTTTSDVLALTSDSSLDTEIDLLSKETLAEPTTPEQAKLLAEKKAKKKALEKYRAARRRYQKTITGKNASDTSEAMQERRSKASESLREAYSAYVGLTSKGGTVNSKNIDADVTALLDSIALNRDQYGLVDAINSLNSPEKLTEYARRNAAIIADVMLQKKVYLGKSLDLFKNNLRKNRIINEIYKQGFFIGHDEITAYFESGKMPTKIYTVRGRKEVDINSEEAKEIKELLETLAPMFGAKAAEETTATETQETDAQAPAVEATPTVETEFKEPTETPATPITDAGTKYQYNDLPQELKSIIDDMFQKENARRERDGENLIRSVAQYTTLPTPQRVIREYFEKNPPIEDKIAPATTEEAFESAEAAAPAKSSATATYSNQIEKATSVAELDRIQTDLLLDLENAFDDRNDQDIAKLMEKVAERKAELGADAGEVVPEVQPEEKKLAENSMAPDENMINKTARVIDDAASKSKEDLDDDFFDNINEC